MALISMCIQMMQDQIVSKVHWFATEVGIIESEKSAKKIKYQRTRAGDVPETTLGEDDDLMVAEKHHKKKKKRRKHRDAERAGSAGRDRSPEFDTLRDAERAGSAGREPSPEFDTLRDAERAGSAGRERSPEFDAPRPVSARVITSRPASAVPSRPASAVGPPPVEEPERIAATDRLIDEEMGEA